MEIHEENKALKNLGTAIRKIRETNTNLSQSKLAVEIGISDNQMGRIERGETNPTFRTLFKIAKALNTDIKSFL